MAQERAVLRASAHGDADEVARKVSLLEAEHAIARQTRDIAGAKLPSLVDKAAAADQ
jgi:hypothetical protein